MSGYYNTVILGIPGLIQNQFGLTISDDMISSPLLSKEKKTLYICFFKNANNPSFIKKHVQVCVTEETCYSSQPP